VTSAWDQTRCIVLLATIALGHVLLGGCAGQPAVAQADRLKLDELLTLMKSRLELAAQAARETWLSKRAIDDSRAEADEVDSAVNRAFQYSLPPETVRDFFRAQIEAGKHVQSVLHAQWQARPELRPKISSPSSEAPRPRIEPLSTAMLAALRAAYPILRGQSGKQLLQQRANALLKDVPGGAQAATLALAPLWYLTY
jgi:chorismate mutase-like protein